MPAVRPGDRVTVRYRLDPSEVGPEPDAPTLSDAVGDVVGLTSDLVVIATRRRGEVTIRLADVVTVKLLPPAPVRPDATRGG